MKRRDFLRVGLVCACARLDARAETTAGPRIWTVRGPIAPKDLGVCLPHEHVLVDFIGAGSATPDRYDSDEVFRVSLPYLKRLRNLGATALAECTPAYLGRDPRLLRRLSEATGLHILTNTGYYAANGGKHLPAHANKENPDALAARWIREWREGIDGSGIRPGFIKIGVGAKVLSEVEQTIVRAAARTHLASGLTIAAHTGDGEAALRQIDLLSTEGVDASAFLWVHAQNENNSDIHARVAERGAWVEFDGVSPEPAAMERHLALVVSMRRQGRLDRVLLSHDAGWYHVGEPGGGSFRPYDTLFTQFIPALKKEGFTGREIDQITVEHPREVFTTRVRIAQK